MAKKYTEKEVIKEAEKWEGYLEKKSVGTDSQLQNKTWNAGNNNITWFWTWLERNGCLDLQGGAWCDGFVDYCHAVVAGVDKAKASLNGYSGYTPDSAQYFKKAGRWVPSSGKPLVGDQIFFKNSSRICHTGIVTKVTNTTVYTIEGNTSSTSGVVANGGCVRKKSYSLSYSRIAGYGRPLYRDFCIISKGMTGSIVKARQQLLIQKGFSVGADGADGDCGANTVKGIKAAQKALGLPQSGNLNKTTYTALIALEDAKSEFTKYNLTNDQIKKITSLCIQEQGDTKDGIMWEASQMCNLWESKSAATKAKYNNSIYEYIRNSGWYAKAKTHMDKCNGSATQRGYVREVMCEGIRRLPLCVDEHDCKSDLKSVPSNPVRGQTIIKNRYGSTYTYFGKSTCGDYFGAINYKSGQSYYTVDGKLTKN